jgi:CubicO group peptidase (beta-lactamase class C family)
MASKGTSKLLLILFTCLSLSMYTHAQQALPPQFDQYVEKVLKTFDVPGVSISIVKDGKVVLAKGYGIKKLGGNDKVDANTLFSIASNSKAFTSTALAILVEEGK